MAKKKDADERIFAKFEGDEGVEFDIVPSDPQSAFPGLASIAIAPMDNAPRHRSIRIRGIAKFDSVDVMGADAYYKVRVVSCRLEFLMNNAERDPFHSFVKYASKAEIVVKESEKDSFSGLKDKAVGLDAQAGVKKSSMRAALTAKYNRMWKNASTKDLSQAVKFKPDIAVIQDIPNGVRIGHQIFGDPNKPDQLLEGAYLNDRPEDPLLVVNIKGAGSICAYLRIVPGDLRIIDSCTGGRVEPNSPFRNDVDRVMRERVAGIRFAKEFRRAGENLVGLELAIHQLNINKKVTVGEA